LKNLDKKKFTKMSNEIQENDLASQASQSHNQRALAMPKQVNYYMLHNYAQRYYNGNAKERTQILKDISANVQTHLGYHILPKDIMRRFRNMRSFYNKKKDEYKSGKIKSIEWEYYQILDGIISAIPRSTRNRPIVSEQMTEPTPQNPKDPMIHNAQNLVPKVIIRSTSNAQVKLPSEMMPSTSKRRSDELVSLEVKKEKLSPPEPKIICLDENRPLDMSIKKDKVVIEFNNINDITQQLPLRTSAELKNAAVVKISEELAKLDAERLNLDEQRLQLEIKRNEIDKAAYTLTQLLGQVANA
jgi:hypothetical protein